MTTIGEADIEITAQELRHKLVGDLIESGVLRSPRWETAFGDIPRHLFVPRFLIDRNGTGNHDVIDGTVPSQRAEWLKTVYSDESLATKLADGEWVSSSSQPSLMALMLEALEVSGTEQILEVGTGTGYNTALLCHALGDQLVTSIDIDGILVAEAKHRLACLGYEPSLAAADGEEGCPQAAPHDRIIATCAMAQIPRAWITQARENGKILVNLYRDLGGRAMILLNVTNGQASGYFLPFPGGFMPTRTHPSVQGVELLDEHVEENATRRRANISPDVLRDDAFSMFAALRVPAQRLTLVPEDAPEQSWLLRTDGSWAYQTTGDGGESVVVQGGPAKLWDMLENAHSEWEALGRPPRESFGLTVTATGEHHIWHGAPDALTWPLEPR